MKKIFLLVVLLGHVLLANAQPFDSKAAQTMLNEVGFDVGTPDGQLGKKSRRAIRRFQASRNLPVTGAIDKKTWTQLRTETQEVETLQTAQPSIDEHALEAMIERILQKRMADMEQRLQANQQTKASRPTRTQALPPIVASPPPPTATVITAPQKYIPQASDKKLVLGTISKRSKEHSLKKWGPLANYLSANVEGYHFVLIALSNADLYNEGDKIDYLLAHPKMLIQFEIDYGFRPVVTLQNLRLGKSYEKFGIVLFTRNDSPIAGIDDLKGKSIGMVATKAWGGWVLGWHTLLGLGIDPYKDMSAVKAMGSHDKVVYAVQKGEIDVGNTRTDTLERMTQEGKIERKNFKLVYKNTDYGDDFPFSLSSKLYPEWAFAAGKDTDHEINKKIAALLLSLSRDSPVSKAGKNAGWTIPANYQGVHTVLRDLRLPPYEDYGKITITDVLKKYWISILFAILFIIFLFIVAVYFRELSNKLKSTNNMLIETQAQLVQSEKMAGIGTMVAGITHEINTPLAFARSNIEMIKEEVEDSFSLFQKIHSHIGEIGEHLEGDARELIDQLDEQIEDRTLYDMIGYVDKGLNSVADLVMSLKNYSRIDRAQNDVVNLHEGLDSTLLIGKNALKNIAEVHKKYGDLPEIECNPSQINQVVMNILTNAAHAIEEKKLDLPEEERVNFKGMISIETWADEGNFVFLRIADNGKGIKASVRKKIFDPMFTTKVVGKGMGMGLALSKQIIEKHTGKITVESELGEGTAFVIRLPITS